MKKIRVWTLECLDDSNAYDIRAKTKRKAIEILNDACSGSRYDCALECREYYAPDLFTLVDDMLGETKGFYSLISEYDVRTLQGVNTEATLSNY